MVHKVDNAVYNPSMRIFDGKKHAAVLEQRIEEHVTARSKLPRLGIIQIGTNAASQKYINLKIALCAKFEIPVSYHELDAQLSDMELSSQVKSIVDDPSIDGCIIQLPLPRKSLKPVLDLIPTNKDTDMLSSTNQERFYSGDFSFLPPVVRSIKHFLDSEDIALHTKRVFVVGEGFLVGKPVAHYMKSLGAKVDVTEDFSPEHAKNYHLVALCAGVPNLVAGQDLSAGCNVVDFGTTVVSGHVLGDLDIKSDLSHLGSVSLSPGGMGPLVVKYLIMNLLKI